MVSTTECCTFCPLLPVSGCRLENGVSTGCNNTNNLLAILGLQADYNITSMFQSTQDNVHKTLHDTQVEKFTEKDAEECVDTIKRYHGVLTGACAAWCMRRLFYLMGPASCNTNPHFALPIASVNFRICQLFAIPNIRPSPTVPSVQPLRTILRNGNAGSIPLSQVQQAK